MAEVGSIHIAGSIDVSNIKHGLREMQRSLDEMKKSARGSFGDLKRLGGSLKGIAGPLVKIGGGLVAAALGIAALSPQVAPALARMEVGFEKLTRIMGEELRPAFDEFARVFVGFVEWLDSDGRPVIQFLNDVLVATAGALSDLAVHGNEAYNELKSLADIITGQFEPIEIPVSFTINGQEVPLTKEEQEAFGTASAIWQAAGDLAGVGSGFFESLGPMGTIPAALLNIGEAGALAGQEFLRDLGSGVDVGEALNSVIANWFKFHAESDPAYSSMRYMNYGG